MQGDLDELVERSLKQAALWDEVKDKFKQNAVSLSGIQQQRFCIARAISTKPDVVLMDEPASSLDPISTSKIEDLLHELSEEYPIIIGTHNMQQATRASGYDSLLQCRS
jgi:phosphate transport system ATP-binding protein